MRWLAGGVYVIYPRTIGPMPARCGAMPSFGVWLLQRRCGSGLAEDAGALGQACGRRVTLLIIYGSQFANHGVASAAVE